MGYDDNGKGVENDKGGDVADEEVQQRDKKTSSETGKGQRDTMRVWREKIGNQV